MKNTEKNMDKIVAFCKGRGYVYAGSEIYGGLANTWDYGPRHPHESAHFGFLRSLRRLLRSPYGLPRVP